jgi:hypothetical protein
VHLVAGLDALQLAATGRDLLLDEPEARALLDALNGHFGASGLVFSAPVPDRWYLQLPEPIEVETLAPARVRGRTVNNTLAQGGGGRRLDAIVNEVQMLLAAHPVNTSREARGVPTVNSIWLWGGGPPSQVLPSEQSSLPWLTSSDPVLLGWWLQRQDGGARVRVLDLTEPGRWLTPAAVGSACEGITGPPAPTGAGCLLVLDDDSMPGDAGVTATLESAARSLEAAWHGWRSQRSRGRLRVIGRGRAVTITGREPWWRRPRPLEECLTAVQGDWPAY